MLKQPKHIQHDDLFIACLSDLPLRDQKDAMERPFFALDKNGRQQEIEYTSPDGKTWVNVSANPKYGMATIYDADILIWCASQYMELINQGMECIPQTIRFQPYDLLRAIGRNTSGRDYERLRAALERLKATTVKTNIRAGGRRKTTMFGWLDSWTEIVDKETGQSKGMTITPPRWFYEGVLMKGGVLAIHRDYFQLTGGYERWLYKVVRKHAGQQENGCFMAMQTLHQKSGTTREYRKFKADLKRIAARNELPEYHLEWIADTEGGEPTLFMIRRSRLHHTDPGFKWEQVRKRHAPKF